MTTTEKCDCRKSTCKSECNRNHTHKQFWCEKCHPERYEVTTEKEEREKRSLSHTKHGMSNTKFYRTYSSMKCRCIDPNWPRFKDYGGRGIKCEWKSFESFKEDMYMSYLEHVKLHGGGRQTTIDRIDTNGNYCKANCKWSTPSEQQRNKRNSHLITIKGITKTLSVWSDIFGIKDSLAHKRIKHLGWDPVEALTKRVNRKGSKAYDPTRGMYYINVDEIISNLIKEQSNGK